MSALLEVRDLNIGVGKREITDVVSGLSFSLARGQRMGFVGESGSGKTVTALAIIRLLRPPLRIIGGSILLDGVDLMSLSERQMNRVRGGRIAMIYQDPMSALNPVLTIGAQISEAVRLHSDASRVLARAQAIDLLGDVGVSRPSKRFDAYPHEFSGGMRQRVMIAMAISAAPEVLIADEPTTALDVTTQARIMDLLDTISETRQIATMLITHDLAVASGFCDDITVMYAGRIVERAGVRSFYERPVHPYSEALLGAAIDMTIPVDRPITTIGGQPPHPGELEGSCSFCPRCPYAEPICLERRPELIAVTDAEVACHFAEARALRQPETAVDG
ncbi:MAG TPA: ABC transporter ATP-binding protein [Acidimicrobiales bacterium]|nr:ABC transporter ATP-binding protein [Acidimicrobiales bacterium]